VVAKADEEVTAKASVTPYAGFAGGGTLVFNRVAGAMSVAVDGQVVAQKTDPAEGPFEASLPAGQGARVLTLTFHTRGGQAFGLPGKVYVTA
jgi:beta-galactosidase